MGGEATRCGSASLQVRTLSARDIRELVSPAELVPLMRDTFAAVSRGEAHLPLRTGLRLPDSRGALVMMPGYLAPTRFVGVKVIGMPAKAGMHRATGPAGGALAPTNVAAVAGVTRSSHPGLMLLFAEDSLQPVAMLCAATITALRTAAATACATDVLARSDSKVLAMLGSGEQAAAHLEALPLVRRFAKIWLWSRNLSHAQALAQRCGRPVSVASSVQQAVADADVVCTVTSAPTPILFGRDIRPGMHINLIGSSGPDAAEVDDDLVAAARYFVDYRDSATLQAAELLGAIERNRVTATHIAGELGDVIDQRCAGRTGSADLTIYKSVGIAAQDIALAAYVLGKAEQLQVGQMVSM